MIDERMYGLGNAPSAIRELFAYGLKRKAEIGEDKVFDYSIGNPSVPAPQKVADTIEELMKLPPVELHAYSPAAGIPAVRQTIADSIARRYGIPAKAGRVYMTVGAAASIAISLGAVTNAGDEVIVPSPYFPEYKVWIETMGCSIVEVPTQVPSFQLDVEAMAPPSTRRPRPSSSTRRTTRWARCTRARTWRRLPPCSRRRARRSAIRST